jgi:rubrerythrin
MANEGGTFTGNRTGMGLAPVQGKEMMQGAQEGAPSSPGNGEGLMNVREQYIGERMPVGSMPMPSSVKGMVKAAMEVARDHRPNVFLDRLGERLAFERTGVRLYEALISHVEVLPDPQIGPTIHELRVFRDEELRHLDIVRQAIEQLGGDITLQTPSADIVAVEAMGLVQVLTDPRSSRSQCLHAILVAELSDNDGWEMLVQLARSLGHTDMATRFEQALREEQGHLNRVRAWFSAQINADASDGRVGVEA